MAESIPGAGTEITPINFELLMASADNLALTDTLPVTASRYEHPRLREDGVPISRFIEFSSTDNYTHIPITDTDRLGLFCEPTLLERGLPYDIGHLTTRQVAAKDIPFDISPHGVMEVTAVTLDTGALRLARTDGARPTDLPAMPHNLLSVKFGTLDGTRPDGRRFYTEIEKVDLVIVPPVKTADTGSVRTRYYISTAPAPASPGTHLYQALDALTGHEYAALATRQEEPVVDNKRYVRYDFSRAAVEAITGDDSKWGTDSYMYRGTYLQGRLPEGRLNAHGAAVLQSVIDVADTHGYPIPAASTKRRLRQLFR